MNAAIEHEVWREVAGFPLYEASSFGRVRSWNGTHRSVRLPRILRQTPLPAGHRNCSISGPSYSGSIGVHRVVLLAFVGPPPSPIHHGSHLNGQPWDNRPGNLAWETPSENHRHKAEHGTQACSSGRFRRLSPDDEREVCAAASGGATYTSLAKRFGVSLSTISATVARGAR